MSKIDRRKRRRRVRSEGSVYQRGKDGKWVAALTVGYNKNGNQRRRTRIRRTRWEAVEALEEMRRDFRLHPGAFLKGDVSVASFMRFWLEEIVKGNVRPNTFEGYCVPTEKHIIPALGHYKVRELDVFEVEQFYRVKLAEGLARSYVQKMRRVLHTCFAEALRQGVIHQNVISQARMPRSSDEEMETKREVFTVDEVRKLLALSAKTGSRYHPLLVLLATTGLRIGEALGLQWKYVDLDARLIKVRRQLQRHGGRAELVTLKTPKSRRTVPLQPLTVETLEKHKTDQEKEMALLGDGWCQEWDLVFTTSVGTPIHPSHFRERYFYPLLERAGLPRRTPHDLRHFVTTLLIHSGATIPETMAIVGHANEAVTLQIYSHAVDSGARRAIDNLSKALHG